VLVQDRAMNAKEVWVRELVLEGHNTSDLASNENTKQNCAISDTSRSHTVAGAPTVLVN
jgi:hypothetical protein